MQLDCANLQSDLVLVTLMSSTSWKGAEKWSINQPQSSLAYFQNILEVQALVALSPHLNQKIISSKGHEHYVMGLLQCENHGVDTSIHPDTVHLSLHIPLLGIGGQTHHKERKQYGPPLLPQ